MIKKVMLSIMTIALVGTLVSGGVFAYFNDVETASDNSFTAGVLNLRVGADDTCTESITITDLKPGANGIADSWLVSNTGTIAGNLDISVGTVTNYENTCYEMEGDGTSGATAGELGQNLKVAFWMDANNNNGWDTGDYYLTTVPSKIFYDSADSGLPNSAFETLDSYSGKTWGDVQSNVAGPSNAGTFRIEYDLPTDTTNVVQSDNCTFDVTFILTQV